MVVSETLIGETTDGTTATGALLGRARTLTVGWLLTWKALPTTRPRPVPDGTRPPPGGTRAGRAPGSGYVNGYKYGNSAWHSQIVATPQHGSAWKQSQRPASRPVGEEAHQARPSHFTSQLVEYQRFPPGQINSCEF